MSPVCKTWPSMDMLLHRLDIPKDLEALLRERHQAHEGEYVTDEWRKAELPDKVDLPVNACWNADTVQDIREELVDAIFNSLVLVQKLRDQGRRYKVSTATNWLSFTLLSVWGRFQQLEKIDGAYRTD